VSYERLPRGGQFFLSRDAAGNDRHGCFIGVLAPDAKGNGLDAGVLARLIEARLQVVHPRFRRVLAHTPFGLSGPLLVDDPHFDVTAHVREVGLDDAGDGWTAFDAFACRYVREPIDQSRPLWQIAVVPGLPDGRSAILFKLHHAIVDGEAAAASVATLLFDRQPADAPAPAPVWESRAGPRPARRAALALAFQAERGGALARRLWTHALSWRRPSEPAGRLRAMVDAYRTQLHGPRPPSPLNRPVGPRNALVVAMRDVDQVQAARTAGGESASFDDVVLAAIAGGLRTWFAGRGMPPADQVTQLPVGLARRGLGAPTVFAEMPSFMTVVLPVTVADPVERLRHVAAATRHRLAQAPALQGLVQPLTHLPVPLYKRWAGAIYGKAAHFHLASMRGPQIPLYVLGNRLEYAYVGTPVRGDLALRVTVLALAGKVTVTLACDPDIVRDPRQLARGIETALDELAAAAGFPLGQAPGASP